MERSARRVCPTVGPFLRPQSPHESNRRSLSHYRERERERERERKRDRDTMEHDGTRLEEKGRYTGEKAPERGFA